MRRLSVKVILAALLAPFSVAGVATANAEATSGTGAPLERLGPKSNASVYWVGHSLVEVKSKNDWGEYSLMTVLGRLAESRGLTYRLGDNTLWGCPISALWRGKPHSFDRDASEMIAKRETFERTAGEYDTLVVTEGLPLEPSLRIEYSSYYLRRFYCTLLKANPKARVYLYQTWVNFQGNDSSAPPAHKFDWRAEMVAQRKVWERLADEAARPEVRQPSMFDRIGWSSTSDAGCANADPIFMVPAGQAFVALADHLASQDASLNPKLPSGKPLTIGDVFGNVYVDWPKDWPLADAPKDFDPKPVVKTLTLSDPSRAHDDIHASGLGVYFVALVHFATIYRQSPVGLPAPQAVGEDIARLLQCIAWNTVVADPRSGVQGEPVACNP